MTNFNLENLRLEDIAPDSIKISDVMAFFRAIDPELQEITQAIGEALLMTRIDELPEEIVDLLAWQLHVDFYEPLGLDLDRKRALVRNSLIWHRYKGTKYALESMIRILFFENFKIEEWFEYGGKPYFFRLIAWDSLREKEQYNDLIRAIYELKNERSWLEGLRFERETEGIIYIGSVGRHTKKFEIDGYAPEGEIEANTIYFGTVGKYVRSFEIIGILPAASEVATATLHVGAVGKQSRRFMVDGENLSTEVNDMTIHTGLQGRYTRRFGVPAADVEVTVSDMVINMKMATRSKSTTVIHSSEEVEN